MRGLPALLLLLALATGAVLWLVALEGPRERDLVGPSPPVERRVDHPPPAPAPSAATAHALPGPTATGPVPLAATSRERLAAAAAALGQTARRTFSGRLLHPDGTPRAGAELIFVPAPDVLLAAGLVDAPREEHHVPERPLARLHDELPRTLTDEHGAFTLAVDVAPPPGAAPRGPGAVLVAAARDGTALLSVAGDRLGDVVLCGAAPLSLEVVDPQGRPVPGAWCEFVLDATASCACEAADTARAAPRLAGQGLVVPLGAGAASSFVGDALPAASGTLRAGAPGHLTTTARLDVEHATGTGTCGTGRDGFHAPPRIARGQRLHERLVLQPGAPLSGVVLGPDGAPRAGATVTVTCGPGTRYPGRDGAPFRRDDDTLLLALAGADDAATHHAVTDAQGRFAFEVLPWELHDVFVLAERCQPSRTPRVLPGGAPLELRLQPERTLAILVVDEAGQPVGGATLEAWRGSTLDSANALAISPPSAPGEPFVVHAASETLTTLRARAPLHEQVVHEVHAADGPVRLLLPPAGAVSVWLRDGQGAPLPGYRVAVSPSEAPAGRDLRASGGDRRSDANGHVLVEHVTPGTVLVGVTSQGPSSRDFGPPRRVTVPAGRLVEVVLESGPMAHVYGRVQGAEHRWTVQLWSAGDLVSELETSLRGRFGAWVPAGRYDVHVGGERVASVVLTGGHSQQIELPAPAAGRIEGHVSAGGRPVAGLTVLARTPLSSDAPATRTDEAGRYVLPILGGGARTLSLEEHGGGSTRVLHTRSLDVVAGGTTWCDVELPSTSVSLAVRDTDGRPVERCEIVLARVDERPDPREPKLFEALTDAGGRARIAHVPPGRWSVLPSLRDDELVPAGAPFTVRAGEDLVLPDLVLLPLCSVAGRAFMAPGIPAGRRMRVHAHGEGDLHRWAPVGAGGAFSLTRLPPGRWQLLLVVDSGPHACSNVSFPADAGLWVDLAPGDERVADLVLLPLR